MNLLSIGGSDPSTGAGIQSDVKAFERLGAYPLTVITGITAQNTSNFKTVEPVSQKMLKEQIDAITSDFKIDGIKIGMVYDSDIIKTLHRQLSKLKIPIVVDPVIRSTTGGVLLKGSAMADFRRCIVPLATVITPNMYEAETLAGIKGDSKNIKKKIAKKIQQMGAKNIVITGINVAKNMVDDFVLEGKEEYWLSRKKIAGINHGGGCSHSAAMTFFISEKRHVIESAILAKDFASKSIKDAKKVGKGVKITHNTTKQDQISVDLSFAIDGFVNIKNIYKSIPQCQTNFVYSKSKPKSIKNIMGISGRIVKAGKDAIVAGNLKYGGSKHVATALLVVTKKFPNVRSAVNIRYQDATISKIKRLKFKVASYDRAQEPKTSSSTIQWGIKSAIKDSKVVPDAIFHKGDFGKEPMIILFGKTPQDTLEKLVKILGGI